MGGRIYDPTLGRFLQADPFIQAPKNSQSYNRYAYVLNNPMSYTDPSGYNFIDNIFKGINKALGKLAPFVAIAFSIWAPWGTTLWATIGTGFVAGGIATGSLKGALVGALTAGAFHGVGTHFKGLGKLTSGLKATKVLAHGVVGGISSVLSGGKFGHGFASAGFTQALGGAIDGIPTKTGQIIASAVVGGTVSEVTGGKFANGAITGAFSRAFNDAAHPRADDKEFSFTDGKSPDEFLEDNLLEGKFDSKLEISAGPVSTDGKEIGFDIPLRGGPNVSVNSNGVVKMAAALNVGPASAEVFVDTEGYAGGAVSVKLGVVKGVVEYKNPIVHNFNMAMKATAEFFRRMSKSPLSN